MVSKGTLITLKSRMKTGKWLFENSVHGWRSCQGLRCGSTSSYAVDTYEGVAHGECVIYLYPDDPNGLDRSRPIARLYLRWGFKNWQAGATRQTQSASQTLSQRNLQWDNFRGGSDFAQGGANEPVILWGAASISCI